MSRTRKDPSAPDYPLPWIVGGIDVGPAALPVAEIVTWAFELVADVVSDWPEARERVERAQACLAGEAARASDDDLEFAADLIARTLEADVGVSMADVVAILDRIGLPTDAVPLAARPQSIVVEHADFVATDGDDAKRYRNAA
jgi:hypothetical protein